MAQRKGKRWADGERERPDAELEAILATAGVKILAYPKPYWLQAPTETYAIDTLRHVHRTHGAPVLERVLAILIATDKPGEIRRDTIRALAEVVRLFPRWAARPAEAGAALKVLDFDAVRRGAGGPRAQRWVALLARVVEHLAVHVGPGGR